MKREYEVSPADNEIICIVQPLSGAMGVHYSLGVTPVKAMKLMQSAMMELAAENDLKPWRCYSFDEEASEIRKAVIELGPVYAKDDTEALEIALDFYKDKIQGTYYDNIMIGDVMEYV